MRRDTLDSCVTLYWNNIFFICRERIYANMDELYAQVPQEDMDPYAYGNEKIYDSICYYQAPVSVCVSVCVCVSNLNAVSS